MLLEPGKVKSFVKSSVKGRRTKKFSEELLEVGIEKIGDPNVDEHKAREIGFNWLLTKDEYEMCENMVNSFLRRDKLSCMLTDTMKEVPTIGEYRGVPVKGKADIILEAPGGIRIGLDPKSTAKPVSEFVSSAYRYNYDRQAVLYMLLFDLDEFYFIPVEKNPPYTPALLKCSDKFLESGLRKLNKDIDLYKKLFINGEYDPNYLIEKEI